MLNPGDIVIPKDIGVRVEILFYFEEDDGYWCKVTESGASNYNYIYDYDDIFRNDLEGDFADYEYYLVEGQTYYWLCFDEDYDIANGNRGQHKIIPTHFLQGIKL